MKNQPHITVIIPTRERADVFAKSFSTCVTQNYDNLTILVSDNLSQDGTREIALAANDERMRYVNTGKRLSMSQNYEFALSQVSDGWVTIIGDDDGLLPRAIEKVSEIIASSNVNAIRSDTCHYRWPGLPGAKTGTLAVPLRRGTEVRKSRDWLSQVINGTALYPDLPMLYSGGFARASMLDEIRGRNGRFYYSCIPDVFSAFAIASVIDEYVWSFEPLAIDGVSKHSIGTSLVNGAHDRAPVQKFFAENDIPLHPDIPPDANGNVPRVYQAWIYESYLQSRFLRNERDECTQAEQLGITLSSASSDSATMEWGRAFAQRHGLDFDRVLAEAQKNRMRVKMSEASTRLDRALNTYYAEGGRSTPLADVYQASLLAGSVVENPPGRLSLARNLAHKALTKIAAGYVSQ